MQITLRCRHQNHLKKQLEVCVHSNDYVLIGESKCQVRRVSSHHCIEHIYLFDFSRSKGWNGTDVKVKFEPLCTRFHISSVRELVARAKTVMWPAKSIKIDARQTHTHLVYYTQYQFAKSHARRSCSAAPAIDLHSAN